MTANTLNTIPDFSPRPTPVGAAPYAVRSILSELETMGHRLDGGSPRDTLALAEALAAAADRLKAIARNPDIGISSRFALIEGDDNRTHVMHADRRIGFVWAPDAHNARWSICITLRVDEALPAPFRWYITHFQTFNELKAFLSIA